MQAGEIIDGEFEVIDDTDTGPIQPTRKIAPIALIALQFAREHPAEYMLLADNAVADDYNDFYQSLWDQLHRKGALSLKQIACVTRAVEAKAAKELVRATEDRNAKPLDLTPIKTMFDKAVASGYKAPTYRAEGLHISRAPDGGRNPGALYVKADDADIYYGRVVDLKFVSNAAGDRDGALGRLMIIASDPTAAAVAYGRRTGRCAICGRLLTDPESIDRGIGPVCASKWGLI